MSSEYVKIRLQIIDKIIRVISKYGNTCPGVTDNEIEDLNNLIKYLKELKENNEV